MNSQLSIGTERTYDGANAPAIRIDLNLYFNDDAPTELASVIIDRFGKVMADTVDPETADKIFAQIEERARYLEGKLGAAVTLVRLADAQGLIDARKVCYQPDLVRNLWARALKRTRGKQKAELEALRETFAAELAPAAVSPEGETS